MGYVTKALFSEPTEVACSGVREKVRPPSPIPQPSARCSVRTVSAETVIGLARREGIEAHDPVTCGCRTNAPISTAEWAR